MNSFRRTCLDQILKLTARDALGAWPETFERGKHRRPWCRCQKGSRLCEGAQYWNHRWCAASRPTVVKLLRRETAKGPSLSGSSGDLTMMCSAPKRASERCIAES